MSIFKGSGVALVTPFANDGALDFAKLTELIDWHIAEGTDALIICGTTGEASTLKDCEQAETVSVAVSHVKKNAKRKIPVISGAGSNDTAHGKELCAMCEKAGADALLSVTPYYNKTNQRGLIEHFTQLAGAVNIPIILYNVPSRTKLNIEPETASVLADIPNICAIKEANGDTGHYLKMIAQTEGRLDIYAGNDDMIVPIIALGGVGVISTFANVAPRQTHEMCAHALCGDFISARALQLAASPLMEALFWDVNPIPVKQALRFMGKYAGGYRAPLTDMDEKAAARLREVMKKYGLVT